MSVDGAHIPSMPTAAPPDAPRRRRVALVISQLQPGGAERVVVHLGRTFKRLGVEPLVVCLQREGPLADELVAEGVPVIALGSMRGYDLGAVARLAGLLRRFGPDAINVHDRSSLTYVALANRLAGRRPIVFSAHGLLMQDGPGGAAVRRASVRTKGLFTRDVRAVTAVSEPAAREYAALLGWAGPVDVVQNGVPPVPRRSEIRSAARAELGLDDGTFVFLAVGNIKPEKGFEDLLDAAALLRDDRTTASAGGPPVAVLIAGASSDADYERRLREQLERLHLADTVRLLGYRRDTAALYAAADAFVLSSRKEGLPMVLLESMSGGLPVVATRVGAVPEVVRSEVDGLLVEPANAAELAAAMARLMNDRALAARLGERAAQRVAEDYGVEKMARLYLGVFDRVAADRGGHESGLRSAGTAAPAAQSAVAAGAAAAPADPLAPLPGPRPCVLMLAPLPPLSGGMVTVALGLLESKLANRCALTGLNNGKLTPEGRSFLRGVWAQVKLAGQLFGHLVRRRPKIVHIHTCAFFAFWRDSLHAALARALGARVVWHVHDGSFNDWFGSGRRWRTWLIRWSLEAAEAVVVLGREKRDALQPLAPAALWRIVPNGIVMPDLAALKGRSGQAGQAAARRAGPERIGSTRFLFLGHFGRRKGVYDLIEATALARDRGFGGVVEMAGADKEPGDAVRLKSCAKERGLERQIKILGLLPVAEKDRALAAADCLVLPSHGEGLPMSILEAMGCGLPVVATRVGAIPEVVTDGCEGYLIEVGDVAALAECLLKLDRDAELRRRMGAAGRRRVAEDYSQDATVLRVLNVYREAMLR